jgi:hypothetical protein
MSEILAEWVALAQDPAHSKANETADGQSADKAEAGDGRGNIDVLSPPLQSRVMLEGCGADHSQCRDVPIGPRKREQD